MSLDLIRIDRRVATLVTEHRRAFAMAALGQEAFLPDDRFLHDEGFAEIASLDDDLARAIAGWLEALREERRFFGVRRELGHLAREPRRAPELEAETTLAALRRRILSERSDARAELTARAFSSLARPLSDAAIAGWVARLEASRGALSVAGFDATEPRRIAEAFLARSDDLASSLSPPSPVGVLRAALGRDAGEGWPARLNAAWLEDRFRSAGWLEGRRPRRLHLVAPLGATSFARALGDLGAALFEASRAPALPWSLHQHPRSIRRHRRRALFASLALSETFARRALGLGRDRAIDQRRKVARAFFWSLRLDAARVLWLEGLAEGERHARELFAALGETIFGGPPPPSWLATLPALRVTDAAWLAGCVAAADDERSLVHRFDVDWFENPRAAEAIRAEDAGPEQEATAVTAQHAERMAGDLEAVAG